MSGISRSKAKLSPLGKRPPVLVNLLLAVSLAVGAAMSLPQPAAAKQESVFSPVNIVVDGKTVHWQTAPFMYRGTTYVPLRETAELLGASVRWNKSKRATELLLHGDTILHRPGTAVFNVNGDPIVAVSPSLDREGTTMVPLRALAEALKTTVSSATLSGNTGINLTPDAITVSSELTTAADQYLAAQQYSGIALIARDGQILLRKGYGYNGDNRLVHPDQKSRIASLTKSFTAAAVMKLAEEGRLRLDDTLESYIPGFPSGDRITLHMLLSHTSGLTPNFPREQGMTLEQTIEAIKSKPLVAEPASDFRYSNSGYMVLGAIIEQVSGMKYGDYLTQNFLQPLGMNDTGEANPAIPVLKGYVSAGDQKWALAGEYISQSGSGSLYSTIDDMLKWAASFETEQVLQATATQQMFTPYSYKNYGYGWMIKEENGQKTVFHNGSGTGYASGISRELGGGYTIILLGNHAGMDTLTLMNEVRERLP